MAKQHVQRSRQRRDHPKAKYSYSAYESYQRYIRQRRMLAEEYTLLDPSFDDPQGVDLLAMEIVAGLLR